MRRSTRRAKNLRASQALVIMLLASILLSTSGQSRSFARARIDHMRDDAKQSLAFRAQMAEHQAKNDFAILRQLVAYVQTQTVIDPADDKAYPMAPEYTDRSVGIGDAAAKLSGARTPEEYRRADTEITSLTADLRAQLADRSDPTPHNQPHQTDLRLLTYYGAETGKVAVIALAEQTARFYDDGQLVYWSYVTTGGPAQPSAPGYHVAGWRASPTWFISPDPPGSPEWFAPTFIHYAIEYNTGGYFLHDAWWRHQFGPDSNLPHSDPAAFNGGSFGCINFPLVTMRWVYQWLIPGTPIIVY